VGYDAISLSQAIRATLGINRSWRGVLVGVGNLARALLGYRGFRDQGFQIVGLFDDDPRKIGQRLNGQVIESIRDIPERVSQLSADLGILTVPASAAQPVAEKLVAAGIKGLLNFAPAILTLPEDVPVVSVDLSIQLEQLAFQVHDQQM
jgi:redox-sensing transcriptional repressor